MGQTETEPMARRAKYPHQIHTERKQAVLFHRTVGPFAQAQCPCCTGPGPVQGWSVCWNTEEGRIECLECNRKWRTEPRTLTPPLFMLYLAI